jgi:hypothetical protein
MNSVPRDKLLKLVSRYGRDLSDDHRKCEALLRDVCNNQHVREIFVLVSAVKDRAAADLAAPINGTPVPVLLARLSRRLHDRLGIAEDLARWSIDSWAIALGVIPHRIEHDLSSPVLKEEISPTPDFCTADPEDPFAEEASVTAEEMLRRAIRKVLADGVVTDEEKSEVQNLRRALGISSEIASRLFADEKARRSKTLASSPKTDTASADASSVAPNSAVSPLKPAIAGFTVISKSEDDARRADIHADGTYKVILPISHQTTFPFSPVTKPPSPKSLVLTFTGSDRGFADAPVVVGRGQDCSFTVPSSLVSRHHCEFVLFNNEWIVRDLGSRNGTLVNGFPADKEGLFVDKGSRVKLGKNANAPEIVVDLPLASTAVAAPDEVRPRAKFHKVEIDHGVVQDGIQGMVIRSHFQVAGMKNLTGHVGVFFLFQNGKYLKDINQAFRSADGNVYVGTDITPTFFDTEWKELRLFIPYSELHLDAAQADCAVRVQAWRKDSSGKWWSLASATDVPFRWYGQQHLAEKLKTMWNNPSGKPYCPGAAVENLEELPPPIPSHSFDPNEIQVHLLFGRSKSNSMEALGGLYCDVDEGELRKSAGGDLLGSPIHVTVWFRLPTPSEVKHLLRRGAAGPELRELRLATLIKRWNWNGSVEAVSTSNLSAIHAEFRTVLAYGLENELNRRGFQF